MADMAVPALLHLYSVATVGPEPVPVLPFQDRATVVPEAVPVPVLQDRAVSSRQLVDSFDFSLFTCGVIGGCQGVRRFEAKNVHALCSAT